MAQRKNYNLEDVVVSRLEEISDFYGMNQTAVIAMLVTDKYTQIAKDPKKIEMPDEDDKRR